MLRACVRGHAQSASEYGARHVQLLRVSGITRASTLDLFSSAAPFTRCLVCNAPLRSLPYAEAVSRVPDRSARCHDEFFTCDVCDRVYWAGSHTRRLGAVLAKVLAGHSHIATTE